MQRLKKIDIHAHANCDPILPFENDYKTCFVTPEELRKIYDTLGIEKGVFLPLIDQSAAPQPNSLSETLQIIKDYPETFGWWFCNIDPSFRCNNPERNLSFYLEKLKALGAKGVGEITKNLPFDHPVMLNLFRHCEKCNLPVLFHLGKEERTYGIIDDVGLHGLEKVLSMFPDLIFIGHSGYFWNEISGDCDTKHYNDSHNGPVTEGGKIPYLMRKYKNLHCDISAGSGANAMMRDPEFTYKFLEEFNERIYYGADICIAECFNNPLTKLPDFLDSAMENKKISYKAYKNICRDNALRLLSREE